MSVNRNVTTPTGLALLEAGASTSVMLLLRDGPQARGEPPENRKGQCRRFEDGLFEVPAGEGEATRRLDGHDLRDAGLAVEDRQLPEEVARAEDRDLLTAPDDANGARHDQEESRPDLALPGDDVVRREVDLDRAPGDGGQVGRRDAREEPAPGEELGPPVLGERQRVLHVQLRDAATGHVSRQQAAASAREAGGRIRCAQTATEGASPWPAARTSSTRSRNSRSSPTSPPPSSNGSPTRSRSRSTPRASACCGRASRDPRST